MVHRGAELDRSWVCPGAEVAGRVVGSIVGPGVRVERGAEVRHSVLMADAVVRSGASVRRAVLAEHVDVGRGATVGAANARRPVLVGARRRIAPRAHLSAGSELEPTRARDLFRSAR